MRFYRWIFFKLYEFFQKLNSSNSYNSALGVLSGLLMLLVFRFHLLVNKYFIGKQLDYNEIAIPYLMVFVVILAINYFLLAKDSQYLTAEDFFKKEDQTKYNRLLIGVLVLMVVILII